MASTFQALLAELIGTFALVFFGTLSVTLYVVVLGATSSEALVAIALANGITLMVMVYAIGHISGCHINPAVTIAMAALRKISAGRAAGYIAVQLIGASLAAGLHSLILPKAGAETFYGLTLPNADIPISQFATFGLELTFTFFLVFAIFGTVVSGRAPQGFHGLAIGGTLAAAILVGGPLTGASLNPARTFGPALISMNFTAHWAYWLGPIIGALLAALLYRYVLMSKEEVSEPIEATSS